MLENHSWSLVADALCFCKPISARFTLALKAGVWWAYLKLHKCQTCVHCSTGCCLHDCVKIVSCCLSSKLPWHFLFAKLCRYLNTLIDVNVNALQTQCKCITNATMVFTVCLRYVNSKNDNPKLHRIKKQYRGASCKQFL